MIDGKRLYDIIKYNHFSTAEIAFILNISAYELRTKLKKGQMTSNEIEILLHVLHFPCNPMKVFFTTYNYEEPNKIDWVDYIRRGELGAMAEDSIIHRP